MAEDEEEVFDEESQEEESAPMGLFIADDGNLWKRDGEEVKLIGKAIYMGSVQNNIDTHEVTCRIGFDFRGRWREFDVPREKLTEQALPELVGKGADCRREAAKDYAQSLRDQEEQTEVIDVHRRVGWAKVGEEMVFLHAEGIGNESQYIGTLYDLGPSGTLEAWRQAVEEQVIGNPWLELALAVGLSSALVGLLAKRTNIDSLFFHIFGRSSTGKTTATRLAVSPWGLPDTAGAGLVKTWDGSEVSILSNFRENFGVAVALDEASIKAKNESFAAIVYRIAMGRDKQRLHGSSKRQETAEWATTVISNAEHSLLTNSGRNLGIRARLFEASPAAWTTGQENAEALTDALLENHGHAGPELVRYMLEVGEEKLEELWREECAVLAAKLPETDQLSGRVIRKLALIALAGECANAALGLNLDLEAMEERLLLIESASQRERAEYERAFEALKRIVTENRTKFADETASTARDQRPPSQLWGNIARHKTKGCLTVAILCDRFSEEMGKHGFANVAPILKDWKSLGIVLGESDRVTTNRKVGGVQNEVIVINLEHSLGGEVSDETEEARPAAKVSVGKKRPTGAGKGAPKRMDALKLDEDDET